MRFVLLVIICLFLDAAPALAAVVTGTVVDASGAPVPGASVTVVLPAGGERTATTNDEGRFEVADVPEGELIVRAVAKGFAETAVRTSPGTAARLVLQPAPLVTAVSVTASRGAERLETPASTSVLTSAELLNAAAGSLDDALRYTPGFSLFRRSSGRVANPTTQGVTLRGVSGSGASRTMVLADGLPLNDPFGSWVYWNRVPQAAIERVEVVRGAAGDLYGADALGGVVQVLTFNPGRRRLRATADIGSHRTGRLSGFASMQSNGWHGLLAAEFVETDGVITVAPESRGPIDVRAESDYGTGFGGVGYDAGSWHAQGRISFYGEDRNNGTPAQVNDTTWRQVSGEVAGVAGGGAWLARGSGGTQTYAQTFSAVAADRASERLTTEQRTPSSFGTLLGQWTRAFGTTSVLVGGEAHRTKSTVSEWRYAFGTGARSGPFFAGGTEVGGSVFGRASFVPADRLTVVAGARTDFWSSEPREDALPTHSVTFLSPRVSAAYRVNDEYSVQASIYRAHRTPTLNELHRGFRVGNVVTNPNPLLDPERLTGVEGGVLFTRAQLSARLTAFWNTLDDAIANVTLTTTPALITRERQNTDTVRAAGLELEADFRPTERITVSGLAALTASHFTNTPAQPEIDGNRVPQVPAYQLGAGFTYIDPRAFTGTVQLRIVGAQFDDDLNEFELDAFAIADASATQELRPGLQVFVAIENIFDAEYDVGRTPIRTIGWPRSARFGVRLFLP